MKTPVSVIQKRLPCIFPELNIKNHHDHAETKFRVQDLALAQSGRFCFYMHCQLIARFCCCCCLVGVGLEREGGRREREKHAQKQEEKQKKKVTTTNIRRLWGSK